MKTFPQAFLPKLVTCLQEGYRLATFRKDLLAGVTVGVVALPLAMAFAIASGVAPERGIYTAIVGGFLISLFGGSRVQIGGPTGAFVVVIYDILQRQGYDGLVWATLLAGVLLIGMGFARLGSWIRLIPYPLTVGFTSGIAVIVFSSQMRDFFGLQMGSPPAHFYGKWSAYIAAFPTMHLPTVAVSFGTIGLIATLRRYVPSLPWGVISIFAMTLLTTCFAIPVETIQSRFGDIPRTLPSPSLPAFPTHFSAFYSLLPDAITIALLAGVESLLSAVISDYALGLRHRSNSELIAQGIGNIGSALFGGVPATAAIARTATNTQMGAKTPIAGMIHALSLFAFIFFCAPLIRLIPLPALAATLVVVAWNMSELPRFRRLCKAPSGDVLVLFSAFSLTVCLDITVAVGVGMVLSAFLFTKRMSSPASVLSTPTRPLHTGGMNEAAHRDLPSEIKIHRLENPLFFGTADQLHELAKFPVSPPPRAFLLLMHPVDAIDATALQAIEQLSIQCRRGSIHLFLVGIDDSVRNAMRKYGLSSLLEKNTAFANLEEALAHAREIVT